MVRPFVLITNDDGIFAPGIKHLWKAVRDHVDPTIVAPLTEKSGSGVGITLGKPLRFQTVEWENGVPAWSLTGTPADCVKMALSVLLDRRPDFIISGVNRGSNVGRMVLYSGTVGGAIEGALRGIPSIAFSFSDCDIPSLEITQKYILGLLEHFLHHPPPIGTFLNVNFPPQLQTGVKGLRLARQGKGYWMEQPDRRIHPEGLPYYWLGGQWASFEEEAESDVALLEQRYIVAAPIHVGQLTDDSLFSLHKDAVNKLIDRA